MAKQSNRLSWRRQPNETGLARVCQYTRGYDLRIGNDRLASVGPNGRHAERGWNWYASEDTDRGIAWKNSAAEGRSFATAEEAKADAESYIRGCLGLPAKRRPSSKEAPATAEKEGK
ncbi:hypothetical protein ACJ41P_10710 [Azospirillum argentinense]|uniref:AP2 domain-containing protein n=1 Tax=Azospirillum argentinense TaxID=2970906 RepID=A0ABW8V5C8_9PROT